MARIYEYKNGDIVGPYGVKFIKEVEKQKNGNRRGLFICPECGKAAKTGSKNPNFKDLTDKRFGKLTVIKLLGDDQSIINNRKSKEKKNVWLCRCDCGNEIARTTSELTMGNVASCGKCNYKSNGEYKISQLFKDNGILYEHEKRFDACKDKAVLPFDFFLPTKNCCIEYDGVSHYEANPFGSWRTEESVKRQQQHDQIKNQWCKDNNITLIRIPYTHLKDLKIEDLLPETSSFII